MNPENNFLDAENPNEVSENTDVLNEEPKIIEEYPNVGGYDVDELRNAIREARE